MNKILVLNGSPKTNGTISQILKSIKSNDIITVDHIKVYDLNINFCVGCMRCRSDGKCRTFLNDDVEIVRNLIEEANILVVGSPTYFGNMSAKLKSLFERLVPTFMIENKLGIPIPKQKNKKAIIVTSCTTPFPFSLIFRQNRGATNSIKEILKTAGYKIKTIELAGTRNEAKRLKKIKNGKFRISKIISDISY